MPALDPVFVWTAGGFAAAVFGASALMKLRDWEAFAGAVADYRLLPDPIVWPFAIATPILEGACAIGVLFASVRSIATAGLCALLVLFSLAIAINLARGRTDIDCGCFGPLLRQPLNGWLLLRNALLLIIVALGAAPVAKRELAPLDLVSAAGGIAMMVLLYLGANYAIANAPKLRALDIANA